MSLYRNRCWVWIVLSGLALWVLAYGPDQSPGADGGLSAWKNAEPGYRYQFPRDHASHEAYRIEWWYYTGNLTAKDGRRFGYQLTFFRTGVVPQPAIPSRWAVRDLYMAHLAVSDIGAQTFYAFERLNRAGIGWAGAETSAYRVWNEDWEARLEGRDHRLHAPNGPFGLDFRLTPERPEVIHGENGISRKGATAGNASHYYSITRLRTTGRITVRGESIDVTGESWMDHEFGTSFLEREQIGWDWFSIQLEDGRDLMLFQIRRPDGAMDRSSSGTLVEADGQVTSIRFGQFTLTPADRWRSGAGGAAYPTRWTVDLPRDGLHLTVRAAFAGQELRTTESTGVTYWEGSVTIEGTARGRPVRGRGYLEMTGYAGVGMGRVMGLGASDRTR